MGSVGKNAVWQDREIRFDVKLKDLNLRKGEFEIDHLKGCLLYTSPSPRDP